MNKSIKIIYLYILITICIITLFFSNKVNTLYEYIWLWPTMYTLLYGLIFFSIKPKKYHEITFNIIIYLFLPLRYVLYPFILSLNKSTFIGIQHFSLSYDQIQQAIFLGIVELVSASIFIYLIEKISVRKRVGTNMSLILNERNYFKLKGNRTIYIIYIVISTIIYVTFGRRYNLINFITITRNEFVSNSYIELLKFTTIIAIILFVLIIFQYSKIKYENYKKRKYIAIALITALLFISVIQGESRISQIYVAAIMVILLNDMFPSYRKFFTISIIVTAIGIIGMITIFREGDYRQWINSFESIAGRLQIYYGGPVSVATGISVFENSVSVDFSNFIFDYLRSVFGLNLIFRNFGYTTSQLYNLSLYSGQFLNGHLVFSTSYSYIYFGLLGISSTIIINIWLSFIFNKMFYKARFLETKYLFGFAMLRMSSGLFLNTPSVIGGISQYFVMFGFIILISKLFKQKNYR